MNPTKTASRSSSPPSVIPFSRPKPSRAVALRRQGLARIAESLGGKLADTMDFCDERNEVSRFGILETSSPAVTHRTWLARHSITFAAPGTLPPERVAPELNRMIAALAFARVFIEGTNHLNDVQLYDRLSIDVLEGEEPDIPRMENEFFHWDLSESNNPDSKVWLSYYATDYDRDEYAEMFPERPLPPRRKLPFDRDSRLPKAR